ncbi:hypothetical protein CONPUDRAFT_34899, partial [Coniophora puteana RWD-64-598 SS2]
LFPCAPSTPTLAVDLRVLRFVDMLALRTAPNVSAWSDTLEAYLLGMGYKFPMKDRLRRRFQRSYHWYRVLDRFSQEHL